MRDIIKGLIILFMAVTFMNGCAKPFLIITDADNGKAKIVPAGEEYWVRLQAQLGTGYSWKVTSPEKEFAPLGDPVFEQAGTPIPGGIQYQTFKFKARNIMEADLKLQYVQPWEKDFKSAKDFSVKIKIQDKKKDGQVKK